MPKFRKKPVVIEAVQVPTERADAGWTDAIHFLESSKTRWKGGNSKPMGFTIHTLEGDMRADPGDWIIRGVKGEFYPCKPDIFAATYEAVES